SADGTACVLHTLAAGRVKGWETEGPGDVALRREPQRRGHGGSGCLLRDPPPARAATGCGRDEGRRGAAARGRQPLHLVSPTGPQRPAAGAAPCRPGPRVPPEVAPRLQGSDCG